jgi:hypothetical protein
MNIMIITQLLDAQWIIQNISNTGNIFINTDIVF